jgi:hypothetical protein
MKEDWQHFKIEEELKVSFEMWYFEPQDSDLDLNLFVNAGSDSYIINTYGSATLIQGKFL